MDNVNMNIGLTFTKQQMPVATPGEAVSLPRQWCPSILAWECSVEPRWRKGDLCSCITYFSVGVNNEEFHREGHQVSRIEAMPQGKEDQRYQLRHLFTAQKLQALENVAIGKGEAVINKTQVRWEAIKMSMR